LRSRSTLVPASPPASLAADVPLHLDARYRTEEIATAFDLRSKDGLIYVPQMGVVPAGPFGLLLVTLDKAAKKKLPHLQYRDYALSPRLFHWQSQASTTRDSNAGRRHLDGKVTPLLFVREQSKDDRGLGVPSASAASGTSFASRARLGMSRLSARLPEALRRSTRFSTCALVMVLPSIAVALSTSSIQICLKI